MLKEKLIETLTREWAKRSDGGDPLADIGQAASAGESQFKQFLQNRLKDLEVLTREDFEQYANALEKAEMRINALEEKIKSLESQISEK